MRRDEYTSKINRFGKSLEKLLQEDFPGNKDLYDKVDDHIFAIQYEILGQFLKKGEVK